MDINLEVFNLETNFFGDLHCSSRWTDMLCDAKAQYQDYSELENCPMWGMWVKEGGGAEFDHLTMSPSEKEDLKNQWKQWLDATTHGIKDDLENKDYDSVITKSRTLLEEVLIFIIEKMTFERYRSNGNLIKINQHATELLNMRQKNDWDKRINELLGGLHKLVSAISSMRDMNSDAHGAGSGRINIKKREALLVAHSSMMLAEYWLSVHEGND